MPEPAVQPELATVATLGISEKGIPEKDPTVLLFWMFVTLHVVLWTSLPVFTQPNAPLDTMEMLYWGRDFQFGYYKHPPLPAWIAEFSTWIAGNSIWPTYLLSQICIAICFWAAWRFARRLLSPWLALSAAVLLEACYYYNYTTPEFNHNMTLRPLWALLSLCLYLAATTSKKRHWVTFGIVAALGMYAKYQLVFLLLPMVLFSLWNPRARRCWATAGPYLAIGLFLVLFAPHLWWAWQNGFPTVQYALDRTQGHLTWAAHVVYPSQFLMAQLLAVGPALLVALPLTGRRIALRRLDQSQRFERDFLISVVLGPLVLILTISMFKGAYVRSMLGAPLFTFAGVFLFFLFKTYDTMQANRQVLWRCVAIGVAVAGVLAIRNLAGPYLSGHPHRIHFPGKQLASEVQKRWEDGHAGNISIVGGSWWTAANVAFYLPGRPSVYGDLDSAKSPWLDDERMSEDGGVVLWSGDDDFDVDELRRRFPNLRVESPIVLRYQTGADVPPLRVEIAVIDPLVPGPAE